jgi:hypothetical protein
MTLPIYQAGQAESYVQGKGWKYKRSGDQLVLETCPLCNKGGFKFYISDSKGAWDCKYGSCARKGNYYQLLKEFGDAALVKRTSTQDAAPKRRRYTLEDMLTFEMALSHRRGCASLSDVSRPQEGDMAGVAPGCQDRSRRDQVAPHPVYQRQPDHRRQVSDPATP